MKKLLIVVDYQNDFIDGALGFKDADSIEENIIKLIKEFKENGDAYIFTMDTHFHDYLETEEGKNLPIPHCIKGTKGWEIRDALKPFANNIPIFEKDGFFATELFDFISKGRYDDVYLVGLVTDICVFANACIAKSAVGRKGRVHVIKSGVNTFNPEMGEKSFEMLKNLHIECID